MFLKYSKIQILPISGFTGTNILLVDVIPKKNKLKVKELSKITIIFSFFFNFILKKNNLIYV